MIVKEVEAKCRSLSADCLYRLTEDNLDFFLALEGELDLIDYNDNYFGPFLSVSRFIDNYAWCLALRFAGSDI